MKRSLLSSLLLLFILIPLSSHTPETFTHKKYKVTIKGIENVDVLRLKEGIAPNSLDEMVIETKKSKTEVESFEVVLARGPRPVAIPVIKVDGDKFDLSKYSEFARTGDRISIQVTEIRKIKQKDIINVNDVLIIPIK